MSPRSEVMTIEGTQLQPLQTKEWIVGSVPCPPALRFNVALLNQLIRQHNLPIRHMCNAPLHVGEKRYQVPETGREWRVMPLDEDPLSQLEGGFPLPDEVLDILQMMEQANVNPSTFFVAHELPLVDKPYSGRSTLEELLPPPSHKAVQSSAQMGKFARNIFNVAKLPFFGAVGGLALAVAAPAALLATVAVDPILIAIFADPEKGCRPGVVGAWYCVASWVYE